MVGTLVVPRYTSYPVAPETALQASITDVLVINAADDGPIIPAHPGGEGGGGGGVVTPPFLLQEFIIKANTNKEMILFL